MAENTMEYDYIIVGAGSAGCVLANRLTEDRRLTVLLLEAGGKDSATEVRVPAAFPRLFKTAADWAYQTEASPRHPQFWPRGKILGGSSSLNAMMYVRGNRYDYDRWQEQGNPGWSFNDVLPYFRKAEGREGGDPTYRGTHGPLVISDLRSPNPLALAFVEAGVELGLARNPDINGAQQDGVALTQVNQKKGQRWSAADAYLKPALSRPNLTVKTNAHATRILFSGTRASGVEYHQDGQRHTAVAWQEVILCGGAINSPQLLLLSGVGPAAHLRGSGIDIVVNLPGVGQNLQDHPAICVTYACTQPVTLTAAEKPQHLINYLLRGRGPLTSNVGEAIAFIRTEDTLPAPDIEMILGPVYFMNHGFSNPPGHGFTLGAVLLRPKSRGHLTLRTPDPFTAPRIQPNYFSEQDDLTRLVAGVKFARRLAMTRAFAPYRGEEVWPGKEVQDDAALADFVLDKFQTLYHPVGTCKMGTDDMAVVDPELNVRGVAGLRVVDASVMPTIISGHTHAPVVMIAEKAASLILNTAKNV